MVGAVAGRTVPVCVAAVPGHQLVDEPVEVLVRARTELHHRKSGGGVRHKHVAEAVFAAGAERTDGVGEVGEPAGAGLELNQLGVHDRNYASPRAVETDEAICSSDQATPSVTTRTAAPSTST